MSNDGNSGYGFAGGYGAMSTSATSTTAAPPAALIKDTTTAGFAADVIQESRRQPVLVDFWAPWCGPCKQLTPVLEKVVNAAAGKVKLVKMNIDDHPSIAGQLGIQSIPAVIAFKSGQPVDGFMGAVPESQIKAFIDKVAGAGASGGADIADALKAAQEAIAAGDPQGAGEIYAMVREIEPENVAAIAGLAGVQLDLGDAAGAEETLAAAPEAKAGDPALAAVRARIKLAAQVAELGDPKELERRLAADPKDHQARFDLAMIQNAMGERDAAADSLLAIFKAERGWKDQAARTQLLTFFEAWGMTDPATLTARRKLSSMMFS
jgi:putative thioredoxin